ncbi:MAG: enoyl-CoA hydratase-related protein [Pseudomonadota bacterium]
MSAIDYDRYEHLKIEKRGKIAILTLNRPDQRNALNPAAQLELEHVWLDLASDTEVNAIILTGAGKAFSAGGDIRSMIDRFGTVEGFQFTLNVPGGTKRLLQNILDVPQPIIAAVNGDAIGLGATLALFSDVSIISDTAKFGDTHVKVGLVAGDGGTVIWPMLIGANRAKEFLMLGRLASGAECAQMGLINHAVPREQVMDKALEMANQLAEMPIWAVRWTKLSINKSIKDQLNLLLDAAIAFEMLSMNTQDHNEAARAFFEKRSPEFKGY